MDDLEREYLKLSDILNNHMTLETIDTTNYDFLTPTILIPIIHYAKKYNRQIISSDNTKKYIEQVIKQEDTSLTSFLKGDDKYYMKMPTTSKLRLEEDSYTNFVENLDHSY